jgi:multiple sugar transport system ATP-binding protein
VYVTLQALFHHPVNLFVAGFIGSPTMNLVEVAVTGDKLEFGGHRLPVPTGTDLDAYNGRRVILGIRPSDFEDAEVWRDERLPVIEVTADVVEDLGSEAHVLFTVARSGRGVRLSVNPARFHFFDRDTGRAVPAGTRAV